MGSNKKFRRVKGIVLGTKDVGESDKLVVLFSPELGKCNLIAYGSNRFKSRFSNKINMSNVIRGWVRFPQGINKIPSLEDAEVLADFFDLIRGNPLKIFSTNFAVEIINLFVPFEVFDEELNNLTLNFFKSLAESNNDDETFYLLSKFLVSFLKLEGILPYVKNEKNLENSVKFFVISLIKGNRYTNISHETKVDFLEWFYRKVKDVMNLEKIVSIELIKRILT